jgi:hypothetical protein
LREAIARNERPTQHHTEVATRRPFAGSFQSPKRA